MIPGYLVWSQYEVELINIEHTSLDGSADLEEIGRCDIVRLELDASDGAK